MAYVIRFGPKRPPLFSARNLVLLVAVGAGLVGLAASYRDQFNELTATYKPEPRAVFAPATAAGPTIVRLGSGQATSPTEASRIEVTEGDTVRMDGQRYRLVGFETPEKGLQAKCAAERELALRATQRLREIVVGGQFKFERATCACDAGTEGTLRCNDGRLCGILTIEGRSVAEILIGEGLAKRYVCGRTQCPPKQSWC